MARTRWPPGPVNPGLLPRPGRSDRHRRWVPEPGARPTDRLAGQPVRRQPNRRSGRDPGSRHYARIQSRSGKPCRKHYPQSPCRIFASFRRRVHFEYMRQNDQIWGTLHRLVCRPIRIGRVPPAWAAAGQPQVYMGTVMSLTLIVGFSGAPKPGPGLPSALRAFPVFRSATARTRRSIFENAACRHRRAS
jgi:hypothetical protein